MSQEKQTETISTLYENLLELEPKLVTNYVPEEQNALEQKELFMSGKVRNPRHNYNKLDGVDFRETRTKINQIGYGILFNENLNPKHRSVYEEFISEYSDKTRFMELAYAFNHAYDENEKAKTKQDYMRLNVELYGEPSETTYRSLLQEKLNSINQSSFDEDTSQLRSELFEMVGYIPNSKKIERFSPSDGTVEWMHEVVESLYGGMLQHVPEQEKFTVAEVQSIFTDIIKNEFGEAAKGWRVDIEAAQSINVKTTEKRIVIPENRADISYSDLRCLIVHEIGVHMLRSVMGSETDILPLKNGLSDYYDAEEGLALVMEHALKGKYVEGGVEAYITAGLAYCDKKDFRDTYEIKWRLAALKSAKKSGQITGDIIAKAKETAYSSVVRSMRGTDELPWFKDLAYFNGAADMWQYLEKNKGDDIKFTFVLMGKVDPSSIKHQRIAYEAKTK
jgi:hypothetical protein